MPNQLTRNCQKNQNKTKLVNIFVENTVHDMQVLKALSSLIMKCPET